MFGSFGWMELLLILIIVLIIFGAGKIPQLGEGLGKAIKGFKKSVNEADALDVIQPEKIKIRHRLREKPHHLSKWLRVPSVTTRLRASRSMLPVNLSRSKAEFDHGSLNVWPRRWRNPDHPDHRVPAVRPEAAPGDRTTSGKGGQGIQRDGG
jgi:TatA/E family protein of Tat protein translocase